MHISFGHTTPALVTGNKRVTRRFWVPSHAAKFHRGDVVIADDKATRNGGRAVALIILEDTPYLEPLTALADPAYGTIEYEAEGLAWLASKGLTVFGMQPLALWRHWLSGGEPRVPYVVRFRIHMLKTEASK